MKQCKDVHIENDKYFSPFLLAASFSNQISFVGSYFKNGVLFWQFCPQDKAQQLLSQFKTKTETRLPAKDLFDAIDTFWKQVSEAKRSGR